jgi:diacylglycerol kinase (ATP)
MRSSTGLFLRAGLRKGTSQVSEDQIPTLGFLPLGTGNSFLRDFVDGTQNNDGLEYAVRALEERRSRACDVLRLVHKDGEIYYTNLLSVGFAADVATLRHRRFQRLGQFGYLLSIFLCLARLDRRPFPVRTDSQQEFDRRSCLFLTFNNSKFTGGTMMIAPDALTDDGLIEYVRWGPIGRLGLICNLATLYDGTHTRHPLAERQAVRRVEFRTRRAGRCHGGRRGVDAGVRGDRRAAVGIAGGGLRAAFCCFV